MKKYFYYLLFLLPLTFVAVACDDDDNDIPNVGIQATISGGVFEGDEIYVAQGDELVIDALTLINNTDKEGALGAVSYYWDHYLIGTNLTQPFELKLETADQPVGRHLLQAQMPIYRRGPGRPSRQRWRNLQGCQRNYQSQGMRVPCRVELISAR